MGEETAPHLEQHGHLSTELINELKTVKLQKNKKITSPYL